MDSIQKKKLINWIVASVILTLFFTLFFFLNDPLSGHLIPSQIVMILSNSFLPAGVVNLAVAGFILIGRTGIFDTVAFGFIVFGESFRKEVVRRYDSAYTYKKIRDDKRRANPPYLLPYWLLGGISFGIAVVLTIVFMCM